MSFSLTPTDLVAIEHGDGAYLTNKGAAAYRREDYDTALPYYRLAAALGDLQAVANLAYCYFYGRGLPADREMGLSLFRAAAARGSVDAIVKLASIYDHGAEGIPADAERAIYYYSLAESTLRDLRGADPVAYPLLFFALGKAVLPDGTLPADLARAYLYLKIASRGFLREVRENITYHQKQLEEVTVLLDSDALDGGREYWDDLDRASDLELTEIWRRFDPATQ